MTDRLYYTDPYNREFEATIGRVEERDGRTIVVLDRTAFYPTSGGQPFDVGTLGGAQVVDVVDDESGEILHVVDVGIGASLARPRPGQLVRGAIDWARRFDHMQQHTGQHVLSAAFDKLFSARTVSFHLGAGSSTIDLARELPAADIAAAEQAANRVVWENRPVTIRFVDEKEAAALPLRKEPARGGTLRLIDIQEFDLSACGGTHVAHTGAIGVIAVASWERFKGGQRIEFLCGGRALDRFRAQRDALAAATTLLSMAANEVPAGIERLQAEIKEQKRAMSALQTELARYRAGELAASAETTGVGKMVLRAVDGDANGLKSLASAIIANPGFIVALVSTSTPPLVVVARSADVAIKSNDVLAALIAKFGGKGGGRPEMAQGGGFGASAAQILEAARVVLRP
jgi:alanyl-tRNA synthetase